METEEISVGDPGLPCTPCVTLNRPFPPSSLGNRLQIIPSALAIQIAGSLEQGLFRAKSPCSPRHKEALADPPVLPQCT